MLAASRAAFRPLRDATDCILSHNTSTVSQLRCLLARCGKGLPIAMPLDLNKYRPYLDGFDLSDQQKAAMIEALWSIAEAVSDLAYGVHSTQLVKIANDNDSASKSSVIEFFEQAASDPILDEYADFLRTLEAANDNTQEKDKEGTPP